MTSSSPHQSSPPPPPPVRNAPPSSGSKSNNQSSLATGEPHNSQNGGSHRHHNFSAPSSPSRIMQSSTLSTAKTTNSKMSEASPLKAAATLIQTLEIAQTEMTSFAADAARGAESARRNARAAQEIARRYQNRSYPKVKSSFDNINVLDLSSKSTAETMSIGDGRSNYRPSTDNATASVTPRPNPPQMKTFYSHQRREDEHHDVNNDILAIAAELKTPSGGHAKGAATPENGGKKASRANEEDNASQSQLTHINDRKHRSFQTPSSVERIAKHHAEELLQLSLELEKTKQALKSEQKQHQDCKIALGSMQSKAKSLEEQNQKLLEQMEEQRRQSAQAISSLEHKLEESRSKVQSAEEDAELALNIANENSEDRKQLEEELEKALLEIEKLKAMNNTNNSLTMNGSAPSQVVETPKRHVRFADSETKEDMHPDQRQTPDSMFGTPMSYSSNAAESASSHSMVAVGRQVVRRQMVSSPEEVVLQLEMTPAKSAERRQRLRQRMTELDAVIAMSSSTAASPSRFTPISYPIRFLTAETDSNPGNEDAAFVRRKLEECQAAGKILQTSGKRLDLDGYWWRDTGSGGIGKSQQLAHPIQLDAMTRQYCQNVEFVIDRNKKEIAELESLCGYLEKKLVMDDH